MNLFFNTFTSESYKANRSIQVKQLWTQTNKNAFI
jgi:hypothetical protein